MPQRPTMKDWGRWANHVKERREIADAIADGRVQPKKKRRSRKKNKP